MLLAALHWAVFAVFFAIGMALIAALCEGCDLTAVEPRAAAPDPNLLSRWRPGRSVAVAWLAASGWVLVFGVSFARSITGVGGSAFSSDGPSYLTQGNRLEPIMFLCSGVAAVVLVAGLLVAGKRRPVPTWTRRLLAAATWVLLANFMAYCLGCVIYETILEP